MCDGRRDLVLDPKNVVELAFVGLRPDVRAVRRANQLCRNAQFVTRLPNAARRVDCTIQLLCNSWNILRFALEGERGSSPYYAERGTARQMFDEFLGKSIR